ncbi:MAG TPA: cysteine--tRNA ligase [Lentimicrobium sp.]|nr:cysteine--tRNA ligase [Lentimicrobium sp.]
MENNVLIYNTLSRTKEIFKPLHPPFAGLYVCGPTVYGDAHLGHARPAITFDLVFRYLMHIGYKVRYVRNITDVGHLENDADEGEDKIGKKAKLDQLEPMEVVNYYTNRYHEDMDALNVLRPSIEPHASGHIIEQIQLIEQILANGYGYVKNGSVYFNVAKYNENHHYGKLSGRVLEELIANTRDLEGQDEKENPFDFALWKKAQPEHIMRWPSPWSDGFPGWHLECSAMSARYLGNPFDIHGGGMDLLFPHHESEIAQSVSANNIEPVKYWMHNNMITINGQKMGKSLGNFITLKELFSGNHNALEKAYSPMTIRFFILQAHYRSTLDFSNEALQAAEKGLDRLMKANALIDQLKPGNHSDSNVAQQWKNCYNAMNDDFNSPIVISNLFEGVRIINSVHNNLESLTSEDIKSLKELFTVFITEVLGLKDDSADNTGNSKMEGLMDLIIELRKNARTAKDFATSDKIRNELQNLGIILKDTREGTSWEIEK